jgi:hypothetical protein
MLSLSLSITVALNACAVIIKDAEVCGDLGNSASCFHTLSNESRDLSQQEWDAMRVGMLCTSADSFANWKSALEKLCHQTGNCTYELKKNLTEFFNKVSSFQERAKNEQ